MIIVTGASGNLGSAVIERLLERVPAHDVGVSVRDVTKAGSLADRGVRVRSGDFTDPRTLDHAFEGADQVLVISAAIRGGGAFSANAAAIDAAKRAGATRILYTSHQAASADSLFPPQKVHAATEEHLVATGVPFTALRHGFYASSVGIHLEAALETGQIVIPEDGPVSWTAHVDLAEAAAIALAIPGTFNGITAPLTASVALDLGQVCEIISDLVGRTITRVTVNDEEWRTSAIERGLPPMVADFSLGMFMAARRGEFEVVDPALSTVLGRPTTPVETVLRGLLA